MAFSTRLSLLLMILLVACDGAADLPDGATPDAGRSDGGGGVCEGRGDPRPASMPSGREVRFHVTGPQNVFVITQGVTCAPYGIDDLRLALPFNCGCECAPLSPSWSGQQVGDGVTMTWNAERLATYRVCEDCGFADSVAFRTRGVGQAVEAGRHTLRLLVADTAPVGCNAYDGQLDCLGGGGGGGSPTFGDGGLCEDSSLREVTVEFELPETGDVDVDVVIPPAEVLACEGTGPEHVPAERTVRFHLTGPADAYVGTSSFNCDAFEVDDVALQLPARRGCYGDEVPGVFIAHPLGAEGQTIEWDGRAQVPFQACVDCGGTDPVSFESGAPQPIAAGVHTARFFAWPGEPVCNGLGVGAGDARSCGEREPLPGASCAHDDAEVIEVEFTVPETGDVDVDVPVVFPGT